MKYSKLLASIGAASILIAALPLGTAYAQPKGAITTYVQNVTTGGPLLNANNEGQAPLAHKGDTLRYTIEVRNDAEAGENNDITNAKLTDVLPNGIEFVDDKDKRDISENLQTLTPGQKITKTYLVKVTATEDGKAITNTACLSGNYPQHDTPQEVCDPAVIKMVKTGQSAPTPPPAPAPTTPSKGETPKTPITTPDNDGKTATAPSAMPTTGPEHVVLSAIILAIGGYIAFYLQMNRKAALATLKAKR